MWIEPRVITSVDEMTDKEKSEYYKEQAKRLQEIDEYLESLKASLKKNKTNKKE